MKLNKFSPFLLCLFLFLIGCNNLENKYPVNNRYWNTKDYDNVVRKLRFGIDPDEKLPSLSTPDKRVVFEKLVDDQNYKIILDDSKLGIKYRSEISTEFFNSWKDMNQIYRATNRKDQYLYEKELLKVWHFGLGLQLRYFKLGNELITENADDPNSLKVKRNKKSNIQSLIGNFNLYLDEINNENAFSDEGKKLLSQGIDIYFPKLINQYPKADFSSLQQKIELMERKTESDLIKNSLNKISEKIKQEKSEQV